MKIFVVENEELIRKGILKYIERGKRGDEIVGEARDGESAYPMILKTKPDILITDICMPYMSGLELGEEVKKKLPDLQVIIISGYDKFQYAKQAIEMGVSDYLLKPIFQNVLLDAVEKAKATIEESRKQWNLEENLKLHMRQDFFEHLVQGDSSITELYDMSEKLGMELDAQYYAVILLEGKFGIEEWVTVSEAFVFPRENGKYAVLLKSEQEEKVEQILNKFEREMGEIRERENISYGVGMIVNHIRNLPESYSLANKMYAYQYYGFEHMSRDRDNGETERKHRTEAENYSEMIQKAKQYMEKNYNQENMSLNAVSQYVGISPNYLSKIFHKELGISFVEYLVEIRMDHAKKLLRDTNKKMAEIGVEIGYSDANYFYSIFKKMEGCTPKKYRDQMKKHA